MSSEDPGGQLAIRWTAEYDAWRMWKTFSQLGSVGGVPNGTAPCCDQQANTGDPKTDGCRLLMRFMSKISAAANDVSATTSENDVTPPLEDAIDLLEPIFGCFTGVLERSDLRDVQFCLRRHAVLAPLRKNDRATAKVTSFYGNGSLVGMVTSPNF